LRSLVWIVLGVIAVFVSYLFFSSGYISGVNQPLAFTIAGAVLMLGLVLFFQGIYRRGQESKPKQP